MAENTVTTMTITTLQAKIAPQGTLLCGARLPILLEWPTALRDESDEGVLFARVEWRLQ